MSSLLRPFNDNLGLWTCLCRRSAERIWSILLLNDADTHWDGKCQFQDDKALSQERSKRDSGGEGSNLTPSPLDAHNICCSHWNLCVCRLVIAAKNTRRMCFVTPNTANVICDTRHFIPKLLNTKWLVIAFISSLKLQKCYFHRQRKKLNTVDRIMIP